MANYSSQYLENLLATPPINHNDPIFRRILNDLQANILRHHKKKYSSHIFLTFNDKSKARVKIKEFEPKLTTALEQLEHKKKGNPNIIYSFFLTALGYDYLGLRYLSPQSSPAFFKNIDDDVLKGFQRDDKATLFDRSGDLHAMILIASDDKDNLKIENEGLMTFFKEDKVADVHSQLGYLKFDDDKDNKKTSREWFGFVDGISQPRFFPSLNAVENNSALKIDDIDKLSLVLTEDPGGRVFEIDKKPGRERDEKVRVSFGSFMTFLKLEQNIGAFEELTNGLAVEKGGVDNAKASIMGRHLNGKPLILSNPRDNIHEMSFENSFDYNILSRIGDLLETDKDGQRCPLNAHIRKVNPRNTDSNYQKRKITRRGVLYVDNVKSFDEIEQEAAKTEKSKKVGMLFMSYQHSLEEQFEFIVKNWMHNMLTEDDKKVSGRDILTARNKNGDTLVKYKGGVYLFAPSISFLKNMTAHFPPVPVSESEVKLITKSREVSEPAPSQASEPAPTDLFLPNGGLKMGVIRFSDKDYEEGNGHNEQNKINAIIDAILESDAYPT